MLTNKIESQITIDAPKSIVWNYLTHFSSYKEWNPFILSLTGDFVTGRRVKVSIRPLNSKPMHFDPQVLEISQFEKIRWKGKFLIKGIFDGEHYFRLIENADRSTTLIQGEIFSGLFVPFLKTMIETNTLKGFEAMNKELKKRIESI